MSTGLFTPLPDFSLIRRHCSWVWRKRSLATNQLSWNPFPYSACFHGNLPRTSLKGLKSALLKSIVAILLPALFPPCLILNSKSQSHCSQGCPQPSHLQPWTPSLFVSVRLRSTLFLVGTPLLVSGSSQQCFPGTSWMDCFLLHSAASPADVSVVKFTHKNCDFEATFSCQ